MTAADVTVSGSSLGGVSLLPLVVIVEALEGFQLVERDLRYALGAAVLQRRERRLRRLDRRAKDEHGVGRDAVADLLEFFRRQNWGLAAANHVGLFRLVAAGADGAQDIHV